MRISLDNALGIHAQALQLRAQRASVLAANIANADTPNYQARDIDFKATLGKVQEKANHLTVTNKSHISSSSANGMAQLLYRVPTQPSLDGNTVDADQEKAAFAQNALEYQATFRFLNGRIKGLLAAIRGE